MKKYEWEIDTLKSVIRNMENETNDVQHLIDELDSVIGSLTDILEENDEEYL